MKRKTLPPVETLRELFDYDPRTGALTWRARADMRPEWNTRYAGRPAGSDCGHGYLKVSIRKRLFYVHHVVWVLAYGHPLPYEIDHADRNRSNNRIANLRPATSSANKCNRSVQANSSTGVRGVFPLPSGAFCARIGHRRRDRYLGSFPTKQAAAKAYSDAAQELHGEFANPSFI